MSKTRFFFNLGVKIPILILLIVSLFFGSTAQEKQKEISKEEAVSMAMKFGRFKAVSAVSMPRVNYSHTYYYLVTGADEKGRLQIGINPENGEFVRIIRLCPYPGLFVDEMVFEKEEALKICRTFLKEKQLPDIPKGYIIESALEKTVMKKKQFKVIFRHFENDIPVTNDFISFIVSGKREVIFYSKVHHDVKVSTQPKIQKEEAQKIATGILGKESLEEYPKDLNAISVTLKIVYPNHYFRKWTWEWTEEQALVWVVRFGEEEIPALDVWVDASTGEIQGGEIYERPIPELIGIPNQTGDITGIWKPALDLMQFNTGTAHTITGDTTEANVVNAIANGFVFVLQTHGNTTATAERAIISHTGTFDERNLEPDEIPENDLYYALVSCCYSGNDGSGDDFKDIFIDQGALCFQGYYPSINPDPYERALVRYLAEGECLQNAHYMADADTSPWFDIIIEWQAWCWNAIYLAPLKVYISAPSHAGCEFSISATIYNYEAALSTTANDVYAFLELPPGYTLTSGSILQNTASIPYGNSWIATWTVSAPFMNFGNKTFDVIVWSDNLGAAVHDFDNPYHKFEVNVGCPYLVAIQVAAIEEVFRWWKWASKIYPESAIPSRILEYRDLLVKDYRSEYLFMKDPQKFIKTVLEINQHAREFPEEVQKTTRIDRRDLEGYMNSLKEMQVFLENHLKIKIDSPHDFFLKLGEILVDVNKNATSAFGPKLSKKKE